MNSELRALVVGHGDFPEGIVSAVNEITGNGSMLIPVSNRGLNTDGVEAVVREALEHTGIRVVFTDLPGGSATMAVRRIQRTLPGLTVVAGANLPALLDFVQQPGEPSEQATLDALERGKSAMIAFKGSAGSAR